MSLSKTRGHFNGVIKAFKAAIVDEKFFLVKHVGEPFLR